MSDTSIAGIAHQCEIQVCTLPTYCEGLGLQISIFQKEVQFIGYFFSVSFGEF